MIPCLSPNGPFSFALEAAPTRLLVGTATGIVHLRRDEVTGGWSEGGRSLADKHIGALLNGPDGQLYAGCHDHGGLYQSLDEGVTWNAIGQNIVATDIFSLALLDTPHGPVLLAGVEPVSLYRSEDLGRTWVERPAIGRVPGAENWTFPPPPHVPHLKSMTINPTVPNSFFACVEQGALLRTDDGGDSWTELGSMWLPDDEVYNDAHRLIVAPWNPGLLVFASGLGVYRSEDAGSSWARIREVGHYTKYPDVLVVSSIDRAIYVGGPADFPVDWLAGDPTGTVCCSRDEGRTWQPADAGLPKSGRANIEGLSIASYPGGYTLFAGDTIGRVFSSEDRGSSWQQIALAGAVSKGAHHKIARMSSKLPRWAGYGASLIFDRITRLTGRRAGARRRAEFARWKGTNQASQQP